MLSCFTFTKKKKITEAKMNIALSASLDDDCQTFFPLQSVQG